MEAARSITFLFLILMSLPAKPQRADSMVCAKEFTNVLTANYKTFLKREVTGTFALKEGDSIQYVLFQENTHGATVALYDPAATEILKTHSKAKVFSGKLKGIAPGNYYFKIRSGRPLPNSFIFLLNIRHCVPYTATPPSDSTASPPVDMDTETSVKLDSTVYLASQLNLKNKQSIRIPVDSLQGVVHYEIRSAGGPVRYRFADAEAQTIKNGLEVHTTGTLPFRHYFYNLWLENDDPVAGKHVRVTIVQYVRKRKTPLVK
jgi:hypothetical protein